MNLYPRKKRNTNELNYEALHGYLWNMYVPTPNSVFKNVSKLPQGSILEYNIYEKREEIRKYWDVDSIKIDFTGTYEEYVDIIEKFLYESVRLRLEVDVPVGIFLSGGIDSSVIASLAQSQAERKIKTYSIGFIEKKNDDAKVAAEVAKILGTDHHDLYCTPKDAIELIQKIPAAYSEPFADNSQLPMMLLSRMTKEHVTVALSGDGGDELFVGYPSYVRNRRLLSQRKWTGIMNPALRLLSSRLDKYDHKKWMIDKFYNAKDITGIIHLDYITARNLIESLLPNELSRQEMISQYGGDYYEKKGLDIVRATVLQSIHYGNDIVHIIEAHFQLCKPGGIVLISVPTPTLQYRLVRKFMEILRVWRFYDEKPLKEAELRPVIERYGKIVKAKVNYRLPLTQLIFVAKK